jgi:hypothetical protein
MKRKNFENSPNTKINKGKSFKYLFEEDEDNSSLKSKKLNGHKPSKRNLLKSPAKSTSSKGRSISNSKKKVGFDFTSTINEIFNTMSQGNLNKPDKRVKENVDSFNNLPCDHSVSNIVQIKISIENKQSRQETINLLTNFFTDDKFSYYQFSHNPGFNLDRQAYEYLYDRNVKEKMKLDIDYIEAMPKILSTWLSLKNSKEANFFYIVTKLFSMYFYNAPRDQTVDCKDYLRSGVLITNFSPSFEKKLKDNDIDFTVINKANKNRADTGFNSLIYIREYYQVLFFNLFLNEYENFVFDIYSSFPFNSGLFKQNKIQLDKHEINDTVELTFTIYGCVFHKEIQFICQFLKDKVQGFHMNFMHLTNTTYYHVLVIELQNSIKRVEFKDNKYKIFY